MRLNIYTPFFDRTKDIIRRVISYLSQRKEGVRDRNYSVILMDKEDMRRMKMEFFKEDVYTDVITFNYDETPPFSEIYISPEIVFLNSWERGIAFEEELVRVAVHGILHSLGLEDDELWDEQEKYVREIMEWLS